MTDEERDEFLEANKDALKGITIRDLMELKHGSGTASALILIMVMGWVFYCSIVVASVGFCIIGFLQ